jgi:hypothetical protein
VVPGLPKRGVDDFAGPVFAARGERGGDGGAIRKGVMKMVDVPTMERVRDRQERATWTTAGPVITRMPDDEVLALEERAMASTGDASPLGLWAFATGTWIVGTIIGGAFGPRLQLPPGRAPRQPRERLPCCLRPPRRSSPNI